MTSDPADLLARLRVSLEAGRVVPPDVGEWLLGGLRDAERGAGTLDRLLGISAPGRDSLRRRAALRVRDRALAQAAAQTGAPTPWAAAGRLAADLRRGRRSVAPVVQKAEMGGVPVPTTQRGVYAAIRRAGTEAK